MHLQFGSLCASSMRTATYDIGSRAKRFDSPEHGWTILRKNSGFCGHSKRPTCAQLVICKCLITLPLGAKPQSLRIKNNTLAKKIVPLIGRAGKKDPFVQSFSAPFLCSKFEPHSDLLPATLSGCSHRALRRTRLLAPMRFRTPFVSKRSPLPKLCVHKRTASD